MNGEYIGCAIPIRVAGNPDGRLAILFDVHHNRLYRLARRLTPNAEDALDLVQETFLRAARFPNSVPMGIANEEAWLVRVLINVRRDQWRKMSLRERYDRAVFEVNHSVMSDRNPESALVARAAIWQALDIMAPRRRAIIIMNGLEGLAIPAIASLLGISAITVRWHLSMGRRDLTRLLKPYMRETNENS